MFSISQRLVRLIENNAHNLSMTLLKNLQQHPDTSFYHNYDVKELYNRAFDVYSHLGQWISRETTKEDIARHFKALGAQRRKEGFPLAEVIMALIMTRRQLWLNVLEYGFLDTVLDMNQALDLSNKVVLFFDRAIYYTAVGYNEGA